MQCLRATMMGLMMNNIYFEDRDGVDRRLLLFMNKKSGIPFNYIKRLKQGVWLLSAHNDQWIVKEFPTKSKLVQQIALTNELIKHDFNQTYTFIPKPFTMENRVFGLIQYIKPAVGKPFDYSQVSNIVDVIQLLTHFHDTTSQFTTSFRGQIPLFQQLNKWEKRLEDFKQSIHVHKYIKAYSHLNKLFYYGELALEKMNDDPSFFHQEPCCIIHGDVASHNFIRRPNGTLCLIDFDLISIAPRHIDLIQLSTRILPSLNWDADRLFSLPVINKYNHIRPFLAALLYPSDVFREWNYFIRAPEIEKGKKWTLLEELIFDQYKQRIEFYEKLIKRIDSLKS